MGMGQRRKGSEMDPYLVTPKQAARYSANDLRPALNPKLAPAY